MCGPISVEICNRRNSHGAYQNPNVAVCEKARSYTEMLK